MAAPMVAADVLAGPIVRRVEPTLAAVWIALRTPASVRLEVFRELGPRRPADQVQGKPRTDHTLAIGKDLHIAVALFEPTDPLRLDWGQTFAYDLRLTPDGGTEVGLGELELLHDGAITTPDGVVHEHLALGYHADWLPSFVVPPAQALSLKIVHGSCRGTNAPGKDAMAIVDDILAQAIGSPAGRPHMMWLTGDQVYSDSTGPEHVRLINKLGTQLLSGSDTAIERMSIKFEDGTTAKFPVDIVHLPPGRRAHLVRDVAGFSSDEMDSHLLGFGEWAAHYVMGWSNITWPELKPLLSARWPQAVAYQTEWNTLHQVIEQRATAKGVPDDVQKGRDYYEAWRLVPEDARTIDATLTAADRKSLWAPDAQHDGWTKFWGNDPRAAAPDTAPPGASVATPSARQLALKLTPSWYAGQEFFKLELDKDNHITHDSVRDRLHLMRTFHASLAHVRRALANVATYMIFDDHEVTDDWNITAGWVMKSRSNPFGRCILRNALAAFTLFQGWGNDPRAYADPTTPNGMLLAAIAQMFLAPSGEPLAEGPPDAVAAQLDKLLDLRPLDQAPDPGSMRWHFRYDGSGFEILALDTRTRRSYEPDADPRIGQPFTNEANAGLLTDEALHDQIPADPASSVGADGLCIVVAAAPFLGFPAVESLVQPILNRKSMFLPRRDGQFAKVESWADVGRVEMDPEPWGYVPRLFAAVLERLASRRRIVILSGDVHYSCTLAMSYWQQRSGQVTPSRIIQCTSSSLRQMRKISDVEGFSNDSIQQLASRLSEDIERLGWHRGGPDSDPVVPPTGARFNDRVRYLLATDPILLPPESLPPGTTTSRGFDYAWRMGLVIDERDDVTRFGDLAPPALRAPSEGWLTAVHSVAERLIWQTERIPARRWLWWNNVCLVDFIAEVPARVRHSVYCYDLANELAVARPYVIAHALLDVPATEAPPTVPEAT
jgi:hypothetical protein